MNFNANTGARQNQGTGLGRKIKRVSDTSAVGAPIPTSQFLGGQQNPPSTQHQHQQFGQNIPGGFNNLQSHDGFNSQSPPMPFQSHIPQSQQSPPAQYPMYSPGAPQYGQPQYGQNQYGAQSQSSQVPPNVPPQFAMFQQPIVQDMAMQYGQKLADQGKQLMENQFEKWVPVTRLKYYFSVDNKYVINKIRLLFFPFTHKDWSLKFDQENPVQPRYDINAPDLYIPTMAYITYVVLAGLMLGMQNRFSPEQLGIQASSALAYSIFELIIYTITLYVANIPTNLRTLDLVAFSGYKFVIIVVCISISILFYGSGYYIALIYSSLSLGFFLLRTLKTKVLNDNNTQTDPASGINYDPYNTPQPNPNQFDYSVGRKRKLYFLFLIVCIQAFLSFWLSKHLILHQIISDKGSDTLKSDDLNKKSL